MIEMTTRHYQWRFENTLLGVIFVLLFSVIKKNNHVSGSDALSLTPKPKMQNTFTLQVLYYFLLQIGGKEKKKTLLRIIFLSNTSVLMAYL
jgi:hypothetical protein